MTDDYVLNFGIECKRPIDLQAPATSAFLDKISDAAPTLDQIEQDTEKGTIQVFEQGKLRRRREVEVNRNGVHAASGSEISAEERHEFLRIVATAAESLEIGKRDVSVIDLRVAFRIKHWGNHHDLTARALWEPGALYTMLQHVGTPLSEVAMVIKTSPPGRDEFMIVFTVNPRTSLREIRSGEYDGDELSIVCAIARVYGFHRAGSFCDMLAELEDIWKTTVAKPVVEDVVAATKSLAAAEKPQRTT